MIKRTYYILVEGHSEENYIQRLNGFLRDNEYDFIFESKNLDGCFPKKYELLNGEKTYTRIKNKAKELAKQYKKDSKLIVWLDDDLFKRKQLNKAILEKEICTLNSKNRKFIFCYNSENFEDFLIMHLDDDKFQKWHEICMEHNHFIEPMMASIYEKEIIDNIIKDYSKKMLPSEIEINENVLLRLKKRQENKSYLIKSDFIDFIMGEING